MKKELRDLRCAMIQAACDAGHAHLPSAFSILEILYSLYKYKLDHDQVVLSKGHGTLALYAILDMLPDYSAGILPGHPERSERILATTGSLGHGLSLAAGLGLVKKIRGEIGRVYCVLGDEECREGSVLEAARVIYEQNLPVIPVIDCNSHHSSLWFNGYIPIVVDGHSIDDTWVRIVPQARPVAILAMTKKGYGCLEFETNPGAWHHRAPTEEEAKELINAINADQLT